MASDPFTIYNNQVFDNTNVTNNGKFVLDTSSDYNNTGSYNSIRAIGEFSSLTPDPDTNNTNYAIRFVVESSDDSGHWFPIGAMFEPIRHLGGGSRHIIIVQPNIFNIDEGVPVDDWDGQNVTTRISRQQGSLGVDYRVKLEIVESKYGTADAFSSLNITLFGERYNA